MATQYSKKTKQGSVRPPADKHESEIDLDFIGSREEGADTRTLASRKRLHEKMSADIEAFLSRGGKIDQVDRNVMADPPKKPISHYGQRPI
ncbi:hypothetical protein [Oceanicoccus sp. KOV_DT_Chl]|uniref:hypothetical protein n=1 Tax=Oceanicoccus sp. KOV_DT_Chl TaxID=1904639 RepID=UPI001F3DF384|nr:hypothetical protein [Oceanicoccus sp. KOV_DT_Chl]